MSKILILNGSPRPKGNTSELIKAFKQGAEEAGHEVTVFNLQRMNIRPCLGCYKGGKDAQNPCVQKDDMRQIYLAYAEADIIVLASPMYYWNFSAQLKMAIDRLLAVDEKESGEYSHTKKKCVLLMPAAEDSEYNFKPVRELYHSLIEHLGWISLGEVYAGGVNLVGDIIGHPALKEAYQLALAIQ